MPAKPLESWRLFIAIELPAEVRRKLNQHSERLRRDLPDVRASWVREQNLHLTLKFFGDTAVNRVEAISDALRKAANQAAAFEIRIGSCGAFPPRAKPNVLWIGIEDPAGGLKRLHGVIEDCCATLGFQRDTRLFHPHLTIARLRHPHGAKELAQLHEQTGFDVVPVQVNDLCLIRSELSSAGSRYTILARHELRDRGAPEET